MTVMERNTNTSLVNESTKFSSTNPNQQSKQLNHFVQDANQTTNEEMRSPGTYGSSSRKNSTTGSINLGSHGKPASNLSLSSTSSASSSVAYSKQDSPTSNKQFYNSNKHSAYSSKSHSKHTSTSSPHTSRRPSGNSITIKITSENNDHLEDELNNCMKESDFNSNDEEHEVEKEREQQKDRDEGEDTTSNSTTNDYSPTGLGNHKQKKLKEKKLMRSSAQQQHHLVYQESEDLIEEESRRKEDLLEDKQSVTLDDYPVQNMNSAFDELFAAAESGNSSVSAVIEAKMAAAATEAAETNNADTELLLKKVNSIRRSRDASLRSSMRQNGSSVKASSRHLTQDNEDFRLTLNESLASPVNKVTNGLKTAGYLGSPQQLTRSCSCKRPGSFKKMKSKNASPNISGMNSFGTITNESGQKSPLRETNNSQPAITTPSSTSANKTVGGRRGTQCSITIMDDINSNMNESRAGSLPFENFIHQQQQQQQQQHQTPLTPNINEDRVAADIYRVRQFNTTNKGSVINRGDSFKRSFKRSNQSISSNNNNNNNNSHNSSKKDTSPSYLDTNTLNLPDYQDGGMFLSKSSTGSNYGINETSFTNNDGSSSINVKIEGSEITTPNSAKIVPPPIIVQPLESERAYIVYIMGASTVGKNALIKQFKTSEYRGTYDIAANQLNDEESDEAVSVMLDGIESNLQFISMDIDLIKPSSLFEITKENDAFIIVYSISDKSSFHIAIDLLKSIRTSEVKNQPVILVGNKSDLVRKRSISREEGRNLALKFGSKFVETSVAINDKVDDLLAGILKQIRLKEASDKESQRNSTNEIFAFKIENPSGNNSKGGKKHSRNYSDAHLHDLIKKSTSSNNNNGNTSNGALWFKSNTLTRKFFKSKNKEPNHSENEKNNSKSNHNYNNNSTANFSFFHKLFNTIFKKKSNISDTQSVENLFTLPVTLNKFKKCEK